jgi:two-component system NtrC family sensor kinase
VSGDQDGDSSPLDVLPGLIDLARIMADAVTVTDVHRRVVVWNAAAERLYGIPERDALDKPIESLFDSAIVGAGTSSAGARLLTLDHGSWRGRVTDQPRIGRLVGQEIVIEAVLSRLDGPAGEAIGVLSVKRDITDAVALERELASLGSLVTATGEARSRATLAQRALEVVATTTGADHGAIVIAHGDAGRLIASKAFPEQLAGIVAVPWAETPIIRAVAPLGRVVKGATDRLPLTPAARLAFLDVGVQALLVVGLHREEELVGLLALGWRRYEASLPSDSLILLVAATIARGLESARLLEEIVRRGDEERATAERLRRLDELTRVGSNVQTLDELAERSSRLINAALGAAGTAYGILAPDDATLATSSLVDVHPLLADGVREHRPDLRGAIRRWRAGEGGFIEALDAGAMPRDIVALARQAGIVSYAAIPIRDDEAVVGGIVAYFDRPASELELDRSALDRVATIASISLQNFRLRFRLVHSERRYRTLFEESPDAVIVVHADRSIIDANEAALRMFGAEREWLLGRRGEDLAEFDVEGAYAQAAGLHLGQSFTVRTIATRRDGTRFPQEAVVVAIELGGEPRLLVRLHDLTEQERLQAELIQAQKMEATGQLVSGVAHELNNPLASILGFSQLIRRDPALPESLRHNADLLVEEATRTRRIVQNLLDFARQRPPERHPTNIRALIDSVLTLQSYSLGQGPIGVEVDIDEGLPPVELDRGQVQQVLVNLTHNAIYAIRDGGGSRLRISATHEGSVDDERVRITVMDDGSGVAPDDVGHLFEAFFTTKPPADGTGLGLPVSYGIVRSHGGELRYVPSAWDPGAAFTFDLPVRAAPIEPIVDAPFAFRSTTTTSGPATSAPAATGAGAGDGATMVAGPGAPTTEAPSAAASIERPGSGERILVIDDEPSIRTFLEQALRSLGFDPVIAATSDDAIDLAGRLDLAAVLCDHQLAGQSGIDVFDAIGRSQPGLQRRFVMMSGDVLNPTLEAFAAVRDVGLLAKPFDLDTLERTIHGVIGAARATDTPGS